MAIEARKALEDTDLDDSEDLALPDAGGIPDGEDHGERDGGVEEGGPGAKLISLHRRRLPPDPRPLPDMSKYDRLLKPVTTQSKGTTA